MRDACQSYGGVVCTGAVLLITSSGQAQNLFEANQYGNIYEFTQGGARSIFASGLSIPNGLAFNSAGDLFEADEGSGNIFQFTPGGLQSTFASGLNFPFGLAFDSADNLFESDYNYPSLGSIYEFTPNGAQSTFASGLDSPLQIAIQDVTLPVPEPSAVGLLTVGIATLLVRRQRK